MQGLKRESSIREGDYERGLAVLIEKVAGGDHEALAQLYDETNRIVFSLVSRIMGNHESAEEVTCDVFTYVWRKASRYAPDRGAPSAWLLMLTHSRSIDCLRARARQGIAQEGGTAFDHENSGPDPEENVIFAIRREKIQTAMAQLPQKEREAIELAFFSGFSQTEIAQVTEVPLGTVKSRIRVGMMRLRKSLETLEGDYGS